MNVQPYFPEQIVEPGNVADERYSTRLGFVRRVAFGHYLTILAGTWVAGSLHAQLPAPTAAMVAGGLLLVLSMLRNFAGHSRLELVGNALLLAPLLIVLGLLARAGIDRGIPLWSIPIAATCAMGYVAVCGRDFAFLGQFAMSFLGTVAVLVALLLNGIVPLSAVASASGVAAAYLAYTVYDLAALLTRRRLGEELSAVVDLFRDVLNFLTYSFRVIQHWRQFRI
ncbi:MAG TPA: hypothetical protein PLL78_10235 [Fimbriimonadaceae bacterium]|nr:hypothetical protein [Fimbriimonadaceae bacterium]HRJ97054.1 hypothetical protein [Fimbriimonadaceae bacterium]